MLAFFSLLPSNTVVQKHKYICQTLNKNNLGQDLESSLVSSFR